VAEQRSKRDGKYIDLIGHWNPSHNPPLLKIDQQKLNHWQTKGAQVSEAVIKLLKSK
jgi:small subunit ribosomal protein S16